MDGEEYWTRKQSYTVAATLVCDDKKEFDTSMLVGQDTFTIKEFSEILYCIRTQVPSLLL
jgi:hypothetical protein